LDRDSYFSSWFEIRGDKEKYDIWWSDRLFQSKIHWDNILEGNIVEYNSQYMSNQEKSELLEKEDKERSTRDFLIKKNQDEKDAYIHSYIQGRPSLKKNILISFFIFIINFFILGFLIFKLKLPEGIFLINPLIFFIMFKYGKYKLKKYLDNHFKIMKERGFSDSEISQLIPPLSRK
jgi:hypothetical protein